VKNVEFLVPAHAERTLITNWSLKKCRNSYGMSILQAAKALDVSTATYERMEQGVTAPPSRVWVETQFAIFIDENGQTGDENLLFGTFPLRIARDLLDISCADLASMYGYKESTWKRFESNGRHLDKDTVTNIENSIKAKLKQTCDI
jgi:DNA-binding XRE family transcriptional regulator